MRARTWRRCATTAALSALVLVPSAVVGATPALAAAPSSVVIAAAGDIACDPADANFSGSNTATCQMRGTADRVAAIKPSYLIPLGDTQYVNNASQGTQPSVSQFTNGYGTTWGRLPGRVTGLAVRPVPGNHEYGDLAETGQAPLSNASSYFTYFGPNGQKALPASVTDPSNDWYSYDIALSASTWHVIALDGECYALPPGNGSSGCDFGSSEERWLTADLAAHRGQCILAAVHEPRWSWSDDDPHYAALWSDLVAGGVTAVLSGHDHNYQRYAPMDVNGNPSPYGTAEFVVGTGGRGLEPIDRSAPRPVALQATDDTHFGVMKLTLANGSMTFAFQSSSGANIDTGSLSCARVPPTTAPAVTAVAPGSGPSAGGTTVSVAGHGFTSSATVTVAGVAATGVQVSSATALTAVVPSGLTTGDVVVTTSGGASPATVDDQFTHTFSTNGYAVSLTASATRATTGSPVTLTATANQDVGPTPYFLSIIDTTTGAVVALAAKGQVATATLTQSQATTRRYVAQIDSKGRAPVMAVASPQIVQWADASADAPTVTVVTPTSGAGAGGTSVSITGSGFTSDTGVMFGGVPATSVSVTSSTQLVAVSPARDPSAAATVDIDVTGPGGPSAQSAADRFSYVFASNGYDATLSATTTTPAIGGAATLTATANQDMGPTPYWLSIVDVATGTVLAHTGWGQRVSLTVSRSRADAGRYAAEIDKAGGPPVQAADSPVVVTWSGAPSAPAPTVTGVSPPSGPAAGWSTVSVAGNGFTTDSWVSFGSTPAIDVTVTSPTSLTATVPSGSATVHAVVSDTNGSSATSVYDEYTYRFSSNGYSISLAASATAAAVGGNVTLTATANQDLGPTPYTFSIIDATTGAIVAHAGSGSVLSVAVSSSTAITRRFVAQVDNMGAPPLQSVSDPQIVTWT